MSNRVVSKFSLSSDWFAGHEIVQATCLTELEVNQQENIVQYQEHTQKICRQIHSLKGTYTMQWQLASKWIESHQNLVHVEILSDRKCFSCPGCQ